jgi:hypothetical protein
MPVPRMKKWLPMSLLVAAVLMPIMMVVSTDALWVGHDTISLEFLILDAKSGQPIEGATVSLLEKEPEYRANTGQDGVARLVARFMVAGRHSVFRRTRSVNYYYLLKISAKFHQDLTDELQNRTKEPRYHSDTNPPRIIIRLEPAL